MAASYVKYMRLCKEWRVDGTKSGRDLGEYIKKEILQFFRQGESTNIKNEEECERYYQSLTRILNNHHGKNYKVNRLFSASGLTRDECRQIISTEHLTKFKNENIGIKTKIMRKFSNS